MAKLSPIARLSNRQAKRMLKALDTAVEHAGGWSALADRMAKHSKEPCSPQAVFTWSVRGVPAERAVEMEKALDGVVLRQDLRPDIFDGMRSDY